MSLDDATIKAITNYIFEIGQLRMESRHGWLRLGVNPESVAEHTQRAACLGFILASCENFSNPALVATMVLFHDAHETRVGDTDIVQKRYLSIDEVSAAKDQVSALGEAGRAIFQMWQEVHNKSTQAAIIAKDAELLEMVFMARELIAQGINAQEWIDSVSKRLKTESAKQLFDSIISANPFNWWNEDSNKKA